MVAPTDDAVVAEECAPEDTAAKALVFEPRCRCCAADEDEPAPVPKRWTGSRIQSRRDNAAEEDAAEDPELDGALARSWADIRTGLHFEPDGLQDLVLRLFEERYKVCSPATALLQMKSFLSEYLIQDFNYRDFCVQLGTVTEKAAYDEEKFADHVAEHLVQDLSEAAATMLRVAVAIARAFGLKPGDWRDVNAACGSAVRAVPACYQLQRELPGALNDARALRFLPVPTTDAGVDLNPWKTDEGRRLFEEAHNIDWPVIESLTANDDKPKYCFSGVFVVSEVTHLDALTFVRLKAVRFGECPGGFPAKTMDTGDTILWELGVLLGKLLQPGFVIDADWYEMPNEVCFVSSLTSVNPDWAPGAL